MSEFEHEDTEVVEDIEIVESFEDRQRKLAELIKDEERFRLCVAGIYIFLQDLDASLTQSMLQVMNMGGPAQMLKKMVFGKKNPDE